MPTLTRTDATLEPPFSMGDGGQDPAADAIYRQHMQDIYRRTDRTFAKLMLLQWVAGIVFALWVSPLAWTGSDSRTHIHVYAAVILGGLISALPIALAILHPGAVVTRYTIATAQMLMSALLIHLTGGRIETHFHVFGSLAFLAFYRDWRVLVPATGVVAADHALRGLFWPQSVYGLLTVSSWRWVEHAAWVLFEDVFLVMSCHRGMREVQQIAVRTATLQRAHEDQRLHAVEQTELVARLRLTQQEVEAATRAKSEFVANMSHELRTPLNAITLYSELLQENAQEDGRDDDLSDLAKIRGASKHLLGLINGLLDLSKIEAGRMELEIERFDVRHTVDELIGTIDALIRKNGNTLSVTYDGELGTMSADVTKTRQILFNLLSNAAKFTTDGAISLRTSCTAADGVDAIEFVVTDTGIGVTEEQKGRLFRPFVQADTSIARKFGGTGLGLALVSRFCDLMGGSVSVETPEGGGARFTVRLPVEHEPLEGRLVEPAA
ncbi:MAG: HAMP domain-containing sensor histidine kinase [Vicinamibacteraceae bacterium]